MELLIEEYQRFVALLDLDQSRASILMDNFRESIADVDDDERAEVLVSELSFFFLATFTCTHSVRFEQIDIRAQIENSLRRRESERRYEELRETFV